MALKMQFNLNLVQTQKLVMTPELRQAIEILQYNSVELSEFIQDQLLTNPVLEMYGPPEAPDKHADGGEPSNPAELPRTSTADVPDVDWKEWAQEEARLTSHRQQERVYAEEFNLDQLLVREDTLTEHLHSQLQFAALDDMQKRIGAYIIENLDSNGYLSLKNEEISSRFGCDEDAVEDVIQMIQTFEPSGICARDLRECLLIQVQMQRVENRLVIPIIENYLDDLASNRIAIIGKALSATTEEIQRAVDVIRSFEPKPGRIFASLRDVRYVIPDVTIEKVGQEYLVLVNDQAAPRLKVSPYYQSILRESLVEENASSYIQERLQSALRIIRSIEQRRNTLFKVVKTILDTQRDFFDSGTLYLKPMTLKDISEQIGVHESTVSRAVNGKYVQCPRGVFELKYFFQSGVSNTQGDGVSSQSVKSAISELVAAENPRKPISDQHISDELNGRGICVSRRTIAKYREELGIPGSSKRRRF